MLVSDPTPRYVRIQRSLKERIAAGRFAPDRALPTEAQLCEQFGVSRITVTKALEGLVQEGLIVRRRGVGTFVAADATVAKAVRLVGSMDEMLAAPVSGLRRDMLSRQEMPAPAEAAALLALEDGAPVMRAEWLYDSAGGVFAYATVFVPKDIADRLIDEDFTDGRPMIQIVRGVISERVLGGQQSVEPDLAGAQLARHLGLPRRSAVLRVVRTFYAEGGRAVVMGVAWYHPTRYRYIVDLEARGGD